MRQTGQYHFLKMDTHYSSTIIEGMDIQWMHKVKIRAKKRVTKSNGTLVCRTWLCMICQPLLRRSETSQDCSKSNTSVIHKVQWRCTLLYTIASKSGKVFHIILHWHLSLVLKIWQVSSKILHHMQIRFKIRLRKLINYRYFIFTKYKTKCYLKYVNFGV